MAVIRSILAAVLGLGVIVFVATLEGAAAVSVTACNTTDANTIYTPVTGIVLEASMLIPAYGCGKGTDQVYTYLPVLVDSTGRVVAATVYGCDANATFVNLTAASDSSAPLTFTVYVYAWNEQQYVQQTKAIQDAIDLIGSDAISGTDLLARFMSIPATWTTTCQATQTTNIEQLALCQPLTPEGSGPPIDAGPDAPQDASEDAPEDAAMEADGGADGATPDGSGPTDGQARDADAGQKPDAEAGPDARGADGGDGGEASDGSSSE